MQYFFFVIFLVFCTAVMQINRYFFKANDSFSLSRVFKEEALDEWQVPVEDVEAEQILSQPFSYLTRGHQSFVFLSADQHYVLKLCRLPAHKSVEKSLLTALSFMNAFKDLREETSVICANCPINKQVLLVDKLKNHHEINLAKLPWVLQKRGERFFTLFDHLIKEEEKAKKIIFQTIALYKSCWEKDYIDRDTIPDKNFGLLALQPIILDIGQLEKGAQNIPLKEYLLTMTESLRRKLQKESPSLYDYYLKCIE